MGPTSHAIGGPTPSELGVGARRYGKLHGRTEQADPFLNEDILQVILDFVSAPLVVSLVCKCWLKFLGPQLKRLPFELVRGAVDGIVAFLEAEEYVALEDKVDQAMDLEAADEAGAAAAQAILLLDASAEDRAASDLCAAEFILSRVRLQPAPHLTKALYQTLETLSPSDPDDEVHPRDLQRLRLGWEAVLNRKVPATWRFHCMDGEPTAGDFGEDPFGLFQGVQIQVCSGGGDFVLSAGTFSMQQLQNGAEYYHRLREDEEAETWVDDQGHEVPKGTPGAHWSSGGSLSVGRHLGCQEIQITVRGNYPRSLEISADRVLHGPVVPPFKVDRAIPRGPERPERMWLPWAEWTDWQAWVEDDDFRMPVLPDSSPPLLSLFPLPLS